jgi:hypothetical protein
MSAVFDPLFLKNAWEVLVLFCIPIGGGIPAGVVVAQERGLSWITMAVLYFISDVILACVYEPLMLLFLKLFRDKPWFMKVQAAFAQSTKKVTSRYGVKPGPFALVMITFGTDPMTGRSVAYAAGHGFLTGWALTIAGDMIFFSVIMGSTLWLNNILGNGTLAAVIITLVIISLPPLIKKIRHR